jgi:hypothetical protein
MARKIRDAKSRAMPSSISAMVTEGRKREAEFACIQAIRPADATRAGAPAAMMLASIRYKGG